MHYHSKVWRQSKSLKTFTLLQKSKKKKNQIKVVLLNVSIDQRLMN